MSLNEMRDFFFISFFITHTNTMNSNCNSNFVYLSIHYAFTAWIWMKLIMEVLWIFKKNICYCLPQNWHIHRQNLEQKLDLYISEYFIYAYFTNNLTVVFFFGAVMSHFKGFCQDAGQMLNDVNLSCTFPCSNGWIWKSLSKLALTVSD